VLILDVTVHVILPGHPLSTPVHWANKLVAQLLITIALPTLRWDITLMLV
jgi:hypothetical protein